MSEDVIVAGIIGSKTDNGGVKKVCTSCGCDIWLSTAAAELVSGGVDARCLPCTQVQMAALAGVGDVHVVSASTGATIGAITPRTSFGDLEPLIEAARGSILAVIQHVGEIRDPGTVPMTVLHAAISVVSLCTVIGLEPEEFIALAKRIEAVFTHDAGARNPVTPAHVASRCRESFRAMDACVAGAEKSVARSTN